MTETKTTLPTENSMVTQVAEAEGFATCPTCHMMDTVLTNVSLAAGGNWRCTRCGQLWDQKRIATVAAYAAWDLARQRRQAER